MLVASCFHRTSRRFLIVASRSTFSTLPYPKSSETQAGSDGTPVNYPAFYNTTNSNRLPEENLKKTTTGGTEPLPANDVLEAKRVETEKLTPSVATSAEKSAAGLSPLPSSSSVSPTGSHLFQDSKVNSTLVLPGIPVPTHTTLQSGEQASSIPTEHIPSSRFSAFLRSIRSGSPFFPSRKNASSSVDLASTREHFIPVTRPSLIRLIATDYQILDSDEDRLLFHQLCEGFDSAVVQRYHPILNELKHLFDPLNPDNETMNNRQVSYRDRLDNEYWLLQKIDDLLRRANFTELPRSVLLDKFVSHRDSSSIVNIKIDGYDYDVLKFWIMGREQMPNAEKPWYARIFRRSQTSSTSDYFKRVILAVRLKGQDRLYLKAFRDIPLQSLPQLLPIGKLQMGNFERQLLWLTFFAGTGTGVTHLITTMASLNIPGLLVTGSSLTLLLGAWTVRSYFQSKVNYLSSMNRLAFYKNIASNKQLLAMIMDRVEDELSKETLLVYMFIQWRQKQNPDLTTKILELEIENWLRNKINTHVNFNSEQSIEFLRRLGILLPDDGSRPGRLQVIPFKQVIGILPQISRTLSEKNEEWDLVEGYDKKYFEVDWRSVLNEDKLLKKGGWH